MSHRSASDHIPRPSWRRSIRGTLTALLAGIAVVLLLGGCGSSSDEGNAAAPVASATASQAQAATWQTQDASSAGGDAELHSVSFVDATHGWAVGESLDSGSGWAHGVILATNDGGTTWQAQDASSLTGGVILATSK